MKISTLCKYVDQPMVLNKLDRKMPTLLIGAGTMFGVVDSFKNNDKKQSRKKKFLQNSIVISSTIGASLLGTRGLKIKNKKIFGGLMEQVKLSDLQKKQTDAVNRFIKISNPLDKTVLNALNTAREKELSPKQIDILINKLPTSPAKNRLF